MDPSPNQNLTDGLIRPPGSVHPSGGHQVLHGPLTAAHQLASTGNPPAVLDRLRRPARRRTRRRHRPRPASRCRRRPTTAAGQPAAPLRGPGPGRGLPADRDHRRVRHRPVPVPVRGPAGRPGRRGVGRPHPARRPGPHRERHLARPGRPSTPGTGTPEPAAKRILADWRKALAYVTAQQAKKPTQSLVRNSPTSEPPSHGGAPPIIDQDQQRTAGNAGRVPMDPHLVDRPRPARAHPVHRPGRHRQTLGAARDG